MNAGSPTYGEQIRLERINFYQVLDFVISPATKLRKVSYVEMISVDARAQLPGWFVSHAWVTPIADFVRSIEKHCDVRKFNWDDTAYWVSAFAINQYKLEDSLHLNDLNNSSCVKAMEHCFGVLLILDEMGPASAFNRSWCCYEACLAWPGLSFRGENQQHTKAAVVLDICASQDGRAYLLTDGLTEDEAKAEEMHKKGDHWQPRGWELKAKRERDFPASQFFLPGLNLKLEKTSSHRPVDRNRILNTIAGYDLDQMNEQPPDSSMSLSRVERGLRSAIALSCWRVAVEGDSKAFGLRTRLADSLQQDTDRRELDLCLAGCSCLSNAEVARLARALPKGLRSCSLDFGSCPALEDIGDLITHISFLPHLRWLTLSLTCLPLFKNVSQLGQSLAQLTELVSLKLDLSYCCEVDTVDAIGEGLMGLKHLNSLVLGFAGLPYLKSIDELATPLSSLLELEVFELNLAESEHLTSVDKVVTALVQLPVLDTVSLNLQRCSGLTMAGDSFRSIARAQALRTARFDFTACTGSSIQELTTSLAEFTGDSLTLCLGSNKDLTNFEKLGQSLARLKKTTTFVLNTEQCTELKNIGGLGKALQQLTQLTVLNLNFSSCTAITGMHEFAKSLAQIQMLNSLVLRLDGCDLSVALLVVLASSLAKLTAMRSLNLNLGVVEAIARLESLEQLRASLSQLTMLTAFRLELMVSTVTNIRIFHSVDALAAALEKAGVPKGAKVGKGSKDAKERQDSDSCCVVA
eukprot:gnl/TRDRNA2_/TRDRNA2_176603_c5_seq4.p1 gnl/TRDRNA2_/TRDRNA2_176603_c5~~gnl/TRDRNA2_/TRDRNA2_176603_c5_seq4.p1  ORF type:complete len:778 (+),score=120.08 gnl/TRDRNA2_/TRDRNA2_176603_c5_seq4:90-2336(+)